MPPGEISIACPGCQYQLRVPFAAVRRDSMYCPQCGKNIPLSGARTDTGENAAVARPKTKRSSYRPTRKR